MKNCVDRENSPLFEYTLMPTNMRSMMSPKALEKATLHEPFSFTKNCPVLQIPSGGGMMGLSFYRFGTTLFDLEKDPLQESPIDDPDAELRLMNAMAKLMRENDAPAEQYLRIGLDPEKEMTPEYLAAQREYREKNDSILPVEGYEWTRGAREQFRALAAMGGGQSLTDGLRKYLSGKETAAVDSRVIEAFVSNTFPAERLGMVMYLLNIAGRTF
jgi:hypothetical protein